MSSSSRGGGFPYSPRPPPPCLSGLLSLLRAASRSFSRFSMSTSLTCAQNSRHEIERW